MFLCVFFCIFFFFVYLGMSYVINDIEKTALCQSCTEDHSHEVALWESIGIKQLEYY